MKDYVCGRHIVFKTYQTKLNSSQEISLRVFKIRVITIENSKKENISLKKVSIKSPKKKVQKRLRDF